MTEMHPITSFSSVSLSNPDFSKKMLLQWAIQQAENAINQMKAAQARANKKLRKAETGEL